MVVGNRLEPTGSHYLYQAELQTLNKPVCTKKWEHNFLISLLLECDNFIALLNIWCHARMACHFICNP